MGEQENYFEAIMAGKLNLIHLCEITYIKEGVLRVNPPAIEQLLYEMEVFDEARKAIALDERAWGLTQASWFGKCIEELTTLEENIKEEAKAKILAWIENDMMSKDAVPKDEIKSWINDDSIVCWIKVLLQKKCDMVSVEALNKILEAEKIEYQIKIAGKKEVNNSQTNIYKFEKSEMVQK